MKDNGKLTGDLMGQYLKQKEPWIMEYSSEQYEAPKVQGRCGRTNDQTTVEAQEAMHT